MDVTEVYAVVAGSLFAVLTTVNFCIHLWTWFQTYAVWILRHLVYPFFLRRHRLLGPWSRRGFILRNIYILTNIFCSAYRTQSITEAGNRTGILSLINLMPLFFGPHFDFLAKLMGVSLHNLQTVHGSAAFMSVSLSVAHAIFSVLGGQWNTLAWSPRLYALISVSSLGLLFFSFAQCIRRPSYELFLRAHQACAALCAYAMWRHVTDKLVFPGLCIYISSGIFVVTTLLELLWITYRNFTLRRGFSRADITVVRGAVRIKIRVRRSWNIRAGQYINVWLPGVGYRALLESHPFMIVSWAVNESWKPKLTTVQLLVEPRDGFTHRLLRYASRSSDEKKHRVLYSGPHGAPTSMKEYGTVLLIATGFGIAAILPHLKELVDGYKRCEVVTRRIHLVWQLKEQGDELAAKDLIDEALTTDTLSWILQISIFYSAERNVQGAEPEGEHGRLFHHGGSFDPREILMREIHGDYERYVDGKMVLWTGRDIGAILVAVSTQADLRDDFRTLVQANMDHNVRFLELEYQPS